MMAMHLDDLSFTSHCIENRVSTTAGGLANVAAQACTLLFLPGASRGKVSMQTSVSLSGYVQQNGRPRHAM